jgi:GNAT superfamily N-acetyltransferase
VGQLELVEKHFSSFFEVPFNIYAKDFPFVSEIKDDLKRFLSDKNPIFKKPGSFSYWTAFRDGKAVGRIVTHIHEASNIKYQWKKSYFGYLDVENNIDTLKALLQKAEDFARHHNCTEVVGNFNLTAMQKAGVLTEFFVHESYPDQIVNPLYLPDLLKQCGYEAFFPMRTFEIDLGPIQAEMLIGPKQQELINSGEFTFEHLNKKNVKESLDAMRVCLNEGMAVNPWFVPLTQEEIEFQAKDLMLVIDEKISILARHKGKAIGAFITIPNLNPFLKNIRSRIGLTTPYYYLKHKMNCDSALTIFYSVFREYHSRGINAVMLSHGIRNLKAGGYKKVGGTWIADENIASLRQVEKLNGKPMHRLHLFRKST